MCPEQNKLFNKLERGSQDVMYENRWVSVKEREEMIEIEKKTVSC